MSGLIVGLVIELPITDEFTSEMKFTAVIYADHAWQDGTHAHPAIATVAKKTGYHERSVQRYVRGLENLGILIPDGKGPHGTNQYKFPLLSADGSFRLDIKSRGGSVPPRQTATGDTDSGDTDSGDTSVTRINQPSVNLVVVNSAAEIFKIYESEIGAITPMISDAINSWLDVEKIPSEWIIEAIQIAVKANARNWKYVEAILKSCKAKNVRPSLNRLERQNANNSTGNCKVSGHKQNTTVYTDADRAAAEAINAQAISV